MNKEYKMDREYSLLEVVRYNLKMWWLAALLAVVFAACLGGYKVVTLHPYVDNEAYEDKMQVKSALFVHEYSQSGVAERAANIIKIADSSRAYNAFVRATGLPVSMEEYRNMFEMEQTEASDVVSVYITFPYTYDTFSIEDQEDAMVFMNGLLKAVDEAAGEMIKEECISVLDAPYATKEVENVTSFSISDSDYKKAVLKAVTAGIILGIIVEIAVYTIWMLIYKGPKNVTEIQECLDTTVVDAVKGMTGDAESYKRAALFLKKELDCNRINCLCIGAVKNDSALKIASCYANEQKKTLYVDLNDSGEENSSVSKYMIGADEMLPMPEILNPYLDAYHRNLKDENGIDIAGGHRYKAFMEEMSHKYEYIVVNSRAGEKNAEGYNVSKLCDTTLVTCARKSVKNEQLYRVKNTVEMNGIHIDGVMVYDV